MNFEIRVCDVQEPGAQIGGKEFATSVDRPWHLEGDTYAFAAFEEPVLLLVNVRTGKLLRTFDLKPLAVDAEHLADTGHRTLVHVAGAGTSIVTLGGRPLPVVGVLDAKSGSALRDARCRFGSSRVVWADAWASDSSDVDAPADRLLAHRQ